MSKQKGIIKLEGNLGGISFYSSDGEHLARIANGPSKESIAKDTAFKRTREHNKEFDGSAKVSKSFRQALGSVLKDMAGRYLTARLTKIFKIINLKANGVRGQRPIELSQYKDTLKNFDLDKKISLTSVFSAPYTVTHTPDRSEATLTVPNFIPDDFIDAPAGATHFKLILALGTVSDFLYNNGTDDYEAASPGQNGLSIVELSTIRPLGATPSTFNLTATLTGSPVLDPEISAVVCLGIEFYQEVGGNFYAFSQDNAMKVIDVI